MSAEQANPEASGNGRGLSVEMRDVRKAFLGHTVLDGINLRCEAGETTIIVGRSGEGKSVTLKHMIGLLRPDSGQILVAGRDLATLDEDDLDALRMDFGMVFQDAALLDSLNVFENIALPLRLHTKRSEEEIAERVREDVRLVGLSENALYKLPGQLSGGMRKRVGFARAVVMRPKVILFDEPTTGLDPIMTDVINSLMLDIQETVGSTHIVISHDLPSAFRIGHRIAMLHNGKIIEEAEPEAFRNSDNPAVRQFLEGRKEGPIQV